MLSILSSSRGGAEGNIAFVFTRWFRVISVGIFYYFAGFVYLGESNKLILASK